MSRPATSTSLAPLGALLLGALALAAGASTGCGGGGGGGSSSLAFTQPSGTGPSTSGPTYGAPAAPTVFTLVTTDNTSRTPMPQSISGFTVDARGQLAQIPDNRATAGSAHQIFTGSGFALSRDRRFLFVGHNSTHAVQAFRVRTDASLVDAGGAPATVSQAAEIVAHPSLDVVYATRTSPSSAASAVEVLGYDATTGALSAHAPLAVADSVRGIAVDPSGRFLATAHMFGAGIGVAVYLLDASGDPLAAPADRKALPTTGRPSRVCFDRTGGRLYVGDLDRGVYAFSVGATGVLTALAAGAPVSVGGFLSDLEASPSQDLLFAVTAFTSEIRPLRIGASGALTALAPLALGDDCEHIAVSRGGAAIYATSRDQSAVHAYDVDPATGAVAERASSPVSVVNPAGVTGSIVVAD